MYRLPKNNSSLVLLSLTLIMTMGAITQPVFGASKTSRNNTSKSKAASKNKAKTVSRVAKCDKNYSGCVPVASDVDCRPGKGNGPKYTTGPKKVLKKDVYKLDADKDRLACEKN